MPVLGDRVVREITIQAPREVVFSFFTDPRRHEQWLGSQAELDPRPGGIYRCVVNDHATALGEFVTVTPYDAVSFTWGFEGNDAVPPGSSTVTVTLAEVAGGTHLTLEHTGLPHPALEGHDVGWDGYLATLVDAAEAGPT
jgi:uncharacterized protein YndB with AHSA1/START domain